MRRFATIFTSLSLGAATLAAAPVLAQAPAAAPAPTGITVGAKTFDSTGAELGTVASVTNGSVVIDLGEGKQVSMPESAFGLLEQGPTIGGTRADVLAAVNQGEASADAKLAAALQVGADVRSANGSAVLGKVKEVKPDGVVMTTASGDVQLPRDAFFAGPSGLATSFTAAQFADAVAATVSTTASPPEATADATGDATDKSGE